MVQAEVKNENRVYRVQIYYVFLTKYSKILFEIHRRRKHQNFHTGNVRI